MNASKETAEMAIEHLYQLSVSIKLVLRAKMVKHVTFLEEFLKAAKRKLPSEAAYTKEKTGSTKFYECTCGCKINLTINPDAKHCLGCGRVVKAP